MRFWTYFKGSNNGDLFVGYRYAIGDNITMLSTPTSLSCETNATDCSWKYVQVTLNDILIQPTEVIQSNFFRLQLLEN